MYDRSLFQPSSAYRTIHVHLGFLISWVAQRNKVINQSVPKLVLFFVYISYSKIDETERRLFPKRPILQQADGVVTAGGTVFQLRSKHHKQSLSSSCYCLVVHEIVRQDESVMSFHRMRLIRV